MSIKSKIGFSLVLLALIVSSLTIHAQNEKNELKPDTNVVNSYIKLIDSLFFDSKNEQALDVIEKANEYFKKYLLNNEIAHIETRRGAIYRQKGEYIKALEIFTHVLEYYQNQNIVKGQASVRNQIGAVYRLQGNYPTALEYYFSSLKLYQTLKEGKKGESSTLNNIGIVYQYQNDFDKALDYYFQSLKIEQKLNNEEGIGLSYLNIGGAYQKKNEFNKALDYYLKALVIAKKGDDLDAIGVIYNEVGYIQLKLNNLKESKLYLDQAYTTFKKINSKFRVSEVEMYFGHYYNQIKDYKSAINHFTTALNLAKETGSVELFAQAQKNLSSIYEATNNPKLALELYKNYITSRDSIYNLENTKKSVQAEMLYKFEKEQESMRIDQAKKDSLVAEKNKRENSFRNFLIVILLLSIVLILIIYIAFKNKQRANITLQKQREEILEKNEELIQQQEEILTQRDQIEEKNTILEKSKQIIAEKNDKLISSIEYAQTIQQAILPNEEVLNSKEFEHFVIFLPKDIVSGDFYWFSKIGDLIFAAVVDCTGHGVPGSFMSLIGNTLLNQIINEWQTNDPALILEYLHNKVRNALKQDELHSKSHVSMDVCLVKVDLKKKKVVFAGAKRPLYKIQNNTFEKITGDHRSVGGFQRESKRYFTNHEFDLAKNTYLYLTTDGYIDQMNTGNRKFGPTKLSQILFENHTKPMQVQKEILLDQYENHKQASDQIDDICILGLKF